MTISLNNQIGAIDAALKTMPAFAPKGQRQSVLEYEKERLKAARTTLEWLSRHETEIKAFLLLPLESRAAVISHGHLVAELAIEMRRREAIAQAGGQNLSSKDVR